MTHPLSDSNGSWCRLLQTLLGFCALYLPTPAIPPRFGLSVRSLLCLFRRFVGGEESWSLDGIYYPPFSQLLPLVSSWHLLPQVNGSLGAPQLGKALFCRLAVRRTGDFSSSDGSQRRRIFSTAAVQPRTGSVRSEIWGWSCRPSCLRLGLTIYEYSSRWHSFSRRVLSV